MAPIKQPRESSSGNRDKTSRRKRSNGTEMLYKCLDMLCGEECEQELLPVTDGRTGRARIRHDLSQDAEMDVVSEYSEDERDTVTRNVPPIKGGRVNKAKNRKALSNHNNEIPFQVGVEKAKFYICEALDFGVQAGYLTPKDSKGKVLRVSSDLLRTSDPNKSRTLQCVEPDVRAMRNEARKQTRKTARRESPTVMMEERDDEGGDSQDTRRVRKQRSRSMRPGKKLNARSRSKSRRVNGKKYGGNGQSKNVDGGESRSKQNSEDTELDDMVENSKDTNGNDNTNDDDNEDNRSVKSAKSAKSTQNSESQNTTEEKKNEIPEDDSEDEDDVNVKK